MYINLETFFEFKMNDKFQSIPYFAVYAGFILCTKSLWPYVLSFRSFLLPVSMSVLLDAYGSLQIGSTLYEHIL